LLLNFFYTTIDYISTARGILVFKPNPLIENNVIAYNGDIGVLVGYELVGSLEFRNNIVCGNKNHQIKTELNVSVDITYSNIENGWVGEGNINKDPKFIDPDSENFHLLPESPCRDSGSPLPQYNDRDGSRNDMGAYGGPHGN
jgi:hypothetical protein